MARSKYGLTSSTCSLAEYFCILVLLLLVMQNSQNCECASAYLGTRSVVASLFSSMPVGSYLLRLHTFLGAPVPLPEFLYFIA